jgi:hypothetical protein
VFHVGAPGYGLCEEIGASIWQVLRMTPVGKISLRRFIAFTQKNLDAELIRLPKNFCSIVRMVMFGLH